MAETVSGTAQDNIAGKPSSSLTGSLKQLALPFTTYIQSYVESSRIDVDLLYMITYMNSIATADIARDEIFRRVSEREEFVCSKYIHQVYLLAKNWNYEYSVACAIVSKRMANKRLKDLLARLANAMSSGEPEKRFLENEWVTMMTVYKNEYERSLESLKKWTDAYTALLVSMAFISVTVLLSVILYNLGDPETTLYGTVFLTAMVGGIGVFILRSEAPKENKTHTLAYCSVEQQQIKDMSKVLIPAAIAFTIFFLLIGINVGFIMIVIGLLIAPIGFVGMMDDKNIDKRDRDFSQFTKMLGSAVGGMGVTVKEAITKVDKKSIGMLEPLVNILYVQLIMGLEPRLCWMKFVGSSGSDLINKFTYIFLDALDLGGDATKIGKLVNSTNLEIVLLRLKRGMVASSFTTLVVPLHISMSALIVFIVEILVIFSTMIEKLYSSMGDWGSGAGSSGGVSAASLGFNLFQNVPVDFLQQYSIMLVIVLTIANTMAAKAVVGGNNYKYCYYGSIMLVTSGLCLIIVPLVVQGIFSFPTLTEGV
ncbi:flagellar assembly protein FlaJ [Methanocella sp. CWC-04]|uniref:Flagellar assembly protein FlaJ n=1 Tax=Methanooceanicella nereidis TaxID=2052831 RepID=A0AAP2RE75_9EURY|nr:archaellar assembly protein FlaJ [Methanocella sp. CWC-04]MCD1296044.1 flagellar assembly protein FlaJ [Methanocella sp. CWC-04]